MRRWGLLVTAVYLFLLYLLFTPLLSFAAHGEFDWLWAYENFDWDWGSLDNLIGIGMLILPILGLLLSQIVLFVSVDRSFRRPIPRSSLKRAVWATALATGFLTAGALMSLAFAIDTIDAGEFELLDSKIGIFMLIFSWIPGWIFWGVVFNRYLENEESLFHKLVSRLLAGSVLELLIAVPCHVYIRYKEECSAPLFSGWGIVTGIAVMLLALGPGVLLLYRKRLQQYNNPVE